jgi:hypothetical protein
MRAALGLTIVAGGAFAVFRDDISELLFQQAMSAGGGFGAGGYLCWKYHFEGGFNVFHQAVKSTAGGRSGAGGCAGATTGVEQRNGRGEN